MPAPTASTAVATEPAAIRLILDGSNPDMRNDVWSPSGRYLLVAERVVDVDAPDAAADRMQDPGAVLRRLGQAVRALSNGASTLPGLLEERAAGDRCYLES